MCIFHAARTRIMPFSHLHRRTHTHTHSHSRANTYTYNSMPNPPGVPLTVPHGRYCRNCCLQRCHHCRVLLEQRLWHHDGRRAHGRRSTQHPQSLHLCRKQFRQYLPCGTVNGAPGGFGIELYVYVYVLARECECVCVWRWRCEKGIICLWQWRCEKGIIRVRVA